MKPRAGFTLIEMLVVVGMIGVLAAAVLTALGPSRQKARDTRVISGLNQLAVIAEVSFDGSKYPTNIDAIQGLPGGRALVEDIKAIAGADPAYNTSGDKFAISSVLPSGQIYCVDSGGTRILSSNTVATNGVCSGGSGRSGGLGPRIDE